jgi:hypothetical protein
VSCFDPHSHIPTKLLYACHIFVWPCNLNLIGPICGLQWLWHAWSIMRHMRNGFWVMFTMCKWPISLCMGLMINCDFSHIELRV